VDDAVEAHAAERVSEGTLSEGFGSATAEFGEVVAQIGSAKTFW
jgi:hypothetical protein